MNQRWEQDANMMSGRFHQAAIFCWLCAHTNGLEKCGRHCQVLTVGIIL